MLIENTSDLIRQVTSLTLASGIPAEAASLINDTVLVITADTLALYRTLEQVGDPLGNGLIRSVSLDTPLEADDGHFIREHRAGYVGLCDGAVLLITLNDVQLFSSKEDALHNRNERLRLSLAL
ncbi:MAG: hypothetical protein CMI02_00315 [Oceanospirillaceae bacterium]|nr:hypothetical protein [Oceanospirillaceae bacterium]MBT10461.1 hypothetical protein [Oceanospirillaceae bacterium]|tara:strand:- start:31912 stop:32283 length:372 start_codon:yes stop_codon:yes gene_type:complete